MSILWNLFFVSDASDNKLECLSLADFIRLLPYSKKFSQVEITLAYQSVSDAEKSLITFDTICCKCESQVMNKLLERKIFWYQEAISKLYEHFNEQLEEIKGTNAIQSGKQMRPENVLGSNKIISFCLESRAPQNG